jgi:rhomboid family GlyGly-CTERM serine protease
VKRGVFPVMTLLLVGSAVAVFAIPGAAALLIFDRDAIARGEWWRIVTGNWVHFSALHLFYDGLAVLIAGTLLEREDRRSVAFVTVSATIAVGATVLLALPVLARYAGLSGIAYALVALVALRGVRAERTWRLLCIAALVLMAAKLAFELAVGRFVFVPTGAEVVPVPLSHAAGIVAALVVWVLTPAQRKAAVRAAHDTARPRLDAAA